MTKWQALWVLEYWSDDGWCIYEPYGTRKEAWKAMAKARWESSFETFRVIKYGPTGGL